MANCSKGDVVGVVIIGVPEATVECVFVVGVFVIVLCVFIVDVFVIVECMFVVGVAPVLAPA